MSRSKITETNAPASDSEPSLKQVLAANAVMLIACVLAGCASLVELKAPDVLPPHVTTRELVEMRELGGLVVSPDGKLAVVRVEQGNIAKNKVDLSWNIIDLGSGKVRRIADAGEPRLTNNGRVASEAPQWSSDGQWVYYRATADQQSQVWRTKSDGSVTQQITHDLADVMMFQVASSGTLDYMVAGATRTEILAAEAAEFDNGVLLDRSVVRKFPLSRSLPINGRMASVRMNLPADLGTWGTLLADRPVRVMTLDLATAKAMPAQPDTVRRLREVWKASYGPLRPFPRDAETRAEAGGKTAEVDASVAAPFGAILSWREADTVHACAHSACIGADQIAIAGWLPNRSDLIFQARTYGSTSLNVWRTADDSVLTLAEGTAMFGSYASGTRGTCQIVADKAICIKAAPDLPPRVVSIDLNDGHEVVLYDPNPNLTPDRLGVAKVFVVHDTFGNSTVIRAVLPRGSGSAPLPLVLTNYDCQGFLRGGSGEDVPEHVLAGMGFAAACVDHGSEARWMPTFDQSTANMNLSGMEFYEGAAKALIDEGTADPRRVALTGFSGGATGAIWTLTKSSMFATGMLMTETAGDASTCYLVAYLGNCQRVTALEGFMPPYDRRDGRLADSPAWNADRVSAPILMQVSEAEYETNLQLWAALSDSGRAIETFVFPEANHFKLRPRQRLAVYNRNIAWLQFWLNSNEKRDVKAADEARWSAMLDRHCAALARDATTTSTRPYFCQQTK